MAGEEEVKAVEAEVVENEVIEPILAGEEPKEEVKTEESIEPILGGEEEKPKDGEPKEGEPKEEEAKEGEGVPEAYEDFKLPEGVEMDAAMLAKADPVFKELGLNQEGAQKLIDLTTELTQKNAEASQKFLEDSVREKRLEWQKEIKSNPDWEADRALGKKAINYYDKTGEFAKLLKDLPYLGDNPTFNRMMAKIGKDVSEDTYRGGDKPSSQLTEEQLLAPNV